MYNIIIAAYNAEDKIFDTLCRNGSHADDIIVVDDCSTDNTFQEIKRYNQTYPKNVDAYRMPVNGHKVGAIKKGVELANEKGSRYVILTDDDTTITNPPEDLCAACKMMDAKNYAGASFVTRPKNPSNLVENLQAMEYETLEYFKKFLQNSGTQRCINGAGGLYKIGPLREVLKKHSEDHDGDDIELTYALQKMGYDTGYFPKVVVETSVPNTLSKRIKQNQRWERGSMKTMGRYKKYVMENIKELNRLSFVQGTEALGHFTLGASRAVLDAAVALHSAITGKDAKKLMLLPIYIPYTFGINFVSRSLACRDIANELIEKSTTTLQDYEYNMERQVWTSLNEAFPDISKIVQFNDVPEISKYLADESYGAQRQGIK